MHNTLHHLSLRSRYLHLPAAAALSIMLAGIASGQDDQTKDQFNLSGRKGTINFPQIFQIPPELKKKEVTGISSKEIPLDGPVIPAEYFVGPGDVLALNIWSSSPVQLELTVSPEGTLLIPNIGSVDAKDLTLERLKTKVSDVTNKRYPRAGVTLTLLSPRKVSVQITGEVFNEGTFDMYSVQRASDLILKADELIPGQTVRDFYEKKLPNLRETASERNILISHRDGNTDRVDLVKYRFRHQGKYNPYLREGDIVYVPERIDPQNSIAVFGAANKFGSFEFVPGDSLSGLILMGYGLKGEADSEHVQFSRLSADGARMETRVIDAKALIGGTAPDIPLNPGDRVFVPERHDARTNYFAAIEGEVAQPGHYPITKNGTRVSDLIRAAGGFTSEAFLRGAMLIRIGRSRGDQDDKTEEERLFSMRSAGSPQDSSYYLAETALRTRGEVVSIDFHRLFVLGDSTQDITLQSFDKVVVPRRHRTVYVFGQVKAPGYVPFVDGKGKDFFVEKAGGYTVEARTGDVKVIKGNTRAWLSPGETTIEDGDYIWVPKEPYFPVSYYLTTYAQIASILGVAATIALVVITARK